jgi:hypothetical protein
VAFIWLLKPILKADIEISTCAPWSGVLQLGYSFQITALQWIGCNNAVIKYCFVNIKNIILMLRIKG